MDEDFEFIETMFKSIFLLITMPLWVPALLAKKLFDKMWNWNK
jgi:ABC-type glycerol-3-phosphate transport system permease component